MHNLPKLLLLLLPFGVESVIGMATMGGSDTKEVLFWSIALFIFGLGTFPLCAKIFEKFKSGGFILSQAMGIIMTSLLTWTLTYLKIYKFDLMFVIAAFVAIAAFCWLYKPLQKAAVSKITDKDFAERAAVEELVFLTVLVLMCYFKGFLPDINGQEKYMDYGFIMSMLRNNRLPANDMWLAQYPINYYYFGQFIWALVIKCTGINTAIAYNIAMCTTTALPCAMSFSFGTMLIEIAQENGFKAGRLPLYLSGTLTGLAVSIWGNSHSFFYDEGSIGNKFLSLFSSLGIEVGKTDGFFYPDSTRYIGHNPEVTTNGGDFTIEEFPFYSFIVGDLHAHVASMTVVILIASLILALLCSAMLPDADELGVSRTKLNFSSPSGRLGKEYKITLSLPFILISVLLGVAQMTNYWDFLIYFIFCSMGVLVVNIRRSKIITDIPGAVSFVINVGLILGIYLKAGSSPVMLLALEAVLLLISYLMSVYTPGALTRTAFQMSFMFTISHLTALPFNMNFDMISNTLGKVKNTSPLYQLGILWGTHVIICLAFFVMVIINRNYSLPVKKSKKRGGKNKNMAKSSDGIEIIGVPSDIKLDPVQKFFAERNIADVFVCGMIVVGLLLLIAPEIFYVRDIYTSGYLRSNTMFKFTFAGFIILSEAMCYSAVRLVWMINRKGKYSVPALVIAIASFILMFIPAHYTGIALKQRCGDITKENYKGLYGLSYIDHHTSSNCFSESEGNLVAYRNACDWFNQNVKGSHIICESYGDSYTDNCIVSAYTGLPTVFGWQTHEWLWRYHGIVNEETDTLVSDPDHDVFQLYITPRHSDVDIVYMSENPDEIQGIINKYKIEYIVLGGLEFGKYDFDNSYTLSQLGDVVYEYDDLTVYKVKPN